METISTTRYIRRVGRVFDCSKILSVMPARFLPKRLYLTYSSGAIIGYNFIFYTESVNMSSVHIIDYIDEETYRSDLAYLSAIINYHSDATNCN